MHLILNTLQGKLNKLSRGIYKAMYRISTVGIESDSCLENLAMRLVFLKSLLYFFS